MSETPTMASWSMVPRKGRHGRPRAAADKYHGVKKSTCLRRAGQAATAATTPPLFAKALTPSATRRKVVATPPRCPPGTGLDKFRRAVPAGCSTSDREQSRHFAAGLAAQGTVRSEQLSPASPATTRSPHVAIRTAGALRQGPSGMGGATVDPIRQLRLLTFAPAPFVAMPRPTRPKWPQGQTMALHDDGPIALRYPRGNGVGVPLPEIPERLEIGKGRIVREGKKVAILSLGTRLEEALKAADALEGRGLSTTVADLRFAKPLDEALIRRLLTAHEVAVTSRPRSAASAPTSSPWPADEGLIDGGLKLRTLAALPPLPGPGKPEKQYADRPLDADGIVDAVLRRCATTAPEWWRARARDPGPSPWLLAACAALLPVSPGIAKKKPPPLPAHVVSDEQLYKSAMECKVRIEALVPLAGNAKERKRIEHALALWTEQEQAVGTKLGKSFGDMLKDEIFFGLEEGSRPGPFSSANICLQARGRCDLACVSAAYAKSRRKFRRLAKNPRLANPRAGRRQRPVSGWQWR